MSTDPRDTLHEAAVELLRRWDAQPKGSARVSILVSAGLANLRAAVGADAVVEHVERDPLTDDELEQYARRAQFTVDSYTLAATDRVWVARKAMRRPDVLSGTLHRQLCRRLGYYPSACEVSAICRLVRAAATALGARASV